MDTNTTSSPTVGTAPDQPPHQPVDTCEVCGGEVAEADAFRTELTVGDVMCPTPMTFHEACFGQVEGIWGAPPEDSTCVVDDEFPETQQWTPVTRPVTRPPARPGT